MENVEKLTNREKRKPKNPIKFQITLNEEQKVAKSIILENAVTMLIGKAGSGKTLAAAQTALDQFFTREVEKIVLVRSTVSKEDLGFLPGDLYDKMHPWLQPILHNMYMLYEKQKIDKMLEDGTIDVVPLAFMRGRTFTNTFIIVDEFQNFTDEQLEMVLSRLGVGSRMVLCGDRAQNDFKRKTDSGYDELFSLVGKVPGLGFYELLQNHRHSIVDYILDEFAKRREEKLQNGKNK